MHFRWFSFQVRCCIISPREVSASKSLSSYNKYFKKQLKKPSSYLSHANCIDFAKVWENKTFSNVTKSNITAADLMDDYCGF